jgi:hypothetical protein
MLARSGSLLQQCRDKLGPSPRSLTQQEQDYFRLRPSFLMRVLFFLGIDKLGIIIRDLHFLQNDGRVVWGYLVQANQLLFSTENHQMLPANVIYSPDTYYDDKPEVLLDVAQSLFQLKGTASDDKDLLKFIYAITNEKERTMRLALPRSVCQGKEAFFTTFLIQPSHLPGGCMASGYFPLLVCPEKTDAVMILPARYWPEELCAVWTASPE